MNIVLIGYRGSGKSTIGRKLAAALGRDFVDTDPQIEARAGRSIPEIFASGGDQAFRLLESEVIRELADRDNLVIAVGGGAVLRAENVATLRSRGKVIWLQAPAAVLFERIKADELRGHIRPNLTAEGGLREVQRLLAERRALYEAAAHVQVEVGELGEEEVVARLDQLC
jgi:shikimate kinase